MASHDILSAQQGILSYYITNPGCLAWSSDGKQLAFGEAGSGVIRIYDAATMRLVRWIPTPHKTVYALSWNPKNGWLASGGEDRCVRLWQADGRAGPVLEGHTRLVCALAWSPDGTQLASGSWGDGTVRIWTRDGNSGPILKHGGMTPGIAWSPDGKLLATADHENRTHYVWDTTNWSKVATLGPFPEKTGCLAWSPDGKLLASDGGDWEKDKIGGWIWDASTWKQKVPLESARSWMNSLEWSNDGKLAVGAQWGVVDLYDPTTGKLVTQTSPQVDPLSCRISSNGQRIADTVGRIWKVEDNGRRLALDWGRRQEMRTWSVAWSPDDKRLASAYGEAIRLWAADGAPELILNGHGGGVERVAWSPDGKRLASATRWGTVRLWAEDGKPGPVLHRHQGIAAVVAWNPKGQQLASGGDADKTIRLWNDGIAGPVLKGHDAGIREIAWHPDGKQFASSSADGTVRLWSNEGVAGKVIKAHEGQVGMVAWSPNGKRLATAGSDDNTVRLWSSDGTPGAILKGHEAGVFAVSWSPDGKWLASGSADQSVRFWEPDGAPGPILKAVGEEVTSLAWSSDSKRLLVACLSGKILCTNGAGCEVEWIVVPVGGDRSVTFSAAGEVLHGNTDAMEEELVYLVESVEGRIELLKPSEFRKRVANPR